jgi:hypothetical protein
MTDIERRKRLLKWLKQITKEARQLAVFSHMFWEVQKMIRKNSRLKTLPSHFFNYLGVTYQSYAAAAIRRQSDGRDDVVSLKRFLTELKKYPHLVSRSPF